MERNVFVPTMALAIINGIFSPWVLAVFILYPVWFPSWAPPYAQLVYLFSSLILSTLTLMFAGVPAALYERFWRDSEPSKAGLLWLGGVGLLTLPAVPNVLRALGLG